MCNAQCVLFYGLHKFLIVVGSDGNIRFWSTQTGKLIHCVHNTVGTDEVPSITYSTSMCGGHNQGRPGLLVTDKEKVLIYQV